MQQSLFFENVHEVLDYTIKALGGYKKVGAAMKPERAPDAAAQWLRDCLNSDKREKLGPDEVLMIARLGREKGVHAYAQFMAAQLDYAAPVPLTPEDKADAQRDALLRAGLAIAEQVRLLQASGIDLSELAAVAGANAGGSK